MGGLNAEAEQMIRDACQAADHDRAATRAFEAYGPEIFSFLVARLRSESDAGEAFSMFAEDLCRGIPTFQWRCSARGYLYTLARNAANRYATAPQNRRERNLSMSGNASLSLMMDQARSVTQAYRRTEVKDTIRELRKQLSEDDQMLLILKVDRDLPWREIAMVMQDEAEPVSDSALDRESSRLRKRFERAKDELRELARQAGLLDR